MENRETNICCKYLLTDTTLCSLYKHYYSDMEKDAGMPDVRFVKDDIPAYLAKTLKKAMMTNIIRESKSDLQTALLENALENTDWELVVRTIAGIPANQ